MNDKRYALCPGFIISRYDKQKHYIGAEHLARLYGVNYHQCVIIDRQRPETYLGRNLSKYIMLRPHYNSNYHLPKR